MIKVHGACIQKQQTTTESKKAMRNSGADIGVYFPVEYIVYCFCIL